MIEQLDHRSQKREAPGQQWHKPLIMGILNITSDSFSDGSLFLCPAKACKRAEEMIAQGLDIIDIGGESSRPGASEVSVDEELSRVIPVIERLRQMTEKTISIDTSKPDVMKAAVGCGATMINDVYALRRDNALITAAELAVPVCLMHMQGNPKTMQNKPDYSDGVISELMRFFNERITACIKAGIKKSNLILDPGFGFGKKNKHNLQLLHHLQQFKDFNLPLLLGVSRKATIGAVLSKGIGDRMIGGLAVALYAAMEGVSIIRTHDIDETSQAFRMIESIYNAG